MSPEKINTWNLPEDPFERQARVSEIADEMCQQYDEIFFRVMNRVLEEVRANNLRNERQRNLGRQALQESELPKTP
jgi:predicted transcriptional regulator